METSSPYRPRVSRETRLLLTAGIVAVAALWLLARIRFPERPVTPNPVPSVLSQLASGPKYDDLAAEIGQLQARLQPSLLAVGVSTASTSPRQSAHPAAAIRLRDDVVATWIMPGSNGAPWNDVSILAHDAASGLAVARLRTGASVPTSPAVPWAPRQAQQSRYLIASDVSAQGVSLRPVFVGSLDSIDSALWSDPLWAVPARTDLVPGSFVFTNSAELAGLVITYGGRPVIVPGRTVLAQADRLLASPPGPAGTLGIDVQDLTPALAMVTGAPAGVVVTWLDANDVGAEHMMVGDVIEAVEGLALVNRQHWDVRMARLSAGETLTIRVRRKRELSDVALVASAPAARPVSRSLGLTLRGRAKIGAEVDRVERASAADRAGLAVGDVITRIADVHAPTPAQVVQSFGSLELGQRVIVAVTRGDTHFVTTVER
jgi:hypothetical protein